MNPPATPAMAPMMSAATTARMMGELLDAGFSAMGCGFGRGS
jgi:hypothetical protein